MTCMGWNRDLDPELHDFYARNLLEPGWAGELDRAEFAYIKAKLGQSPSLKRRWGFRPSAKRLSETRIRVIAMHGVPGNEGRVLALAGRSKRSDLMKDTRAVPRAGPSAMKSTSAERQRGMKMRILAPATPTAGCGCTGPATRPGKTGMLGSTVPGHCSQSEKNRRAR